MSSRPGPRAAPRWRKPLLVALFLGLVAAFVWTRLPKAGYPTDLARIGQGRPALVLAYDANFTGGMAVMELMNAIRADYAGRVDFLVAPLATAEARAFAGRHGASDGTVLLFAGDGRRIDALHQPRTPAELRQAVTRAFGGP